jgi:hypothetical protein
MPNTGFNIGGRINTKMINFFVFLIITIVCTAVRFIQLGHIDFETGFYNSDAGILPYVVYGILLIGFVFYAVYGYKRKDGFYKRGGTRIHDTAGKLCGVILVFVAASVVFSGISSFSQDAVAGILSILGAAGFFILALSLLRERRYMPYAGFCVLLIAAYYVVTAAVTFKEHLVITRMSSPLTHLFLYLLMLFFYFGTGRIFIRAQDKRTRTKAAAFGYTAAALSISETAAFWLYTLFNPGEKSVMDINDSVMYPDISMLAQGIAAVALILTIGTKAKNSKKY